MPKKPFNNPFERLKLGVRRADEPSPRPDERSPEKRSSEKRSPDAAAPPPTHPDAGADAFSTDSHNLTPVRHGLLTDDDLWALAVEGAEPLVDRSSRIKPGPAPITLPAEPLDPELAAYDELRAIVTGAAPFDIADSDEFIEGAARGLDRHVLRRLRRGEFAVQAHVDLHGLTRDEARAELEAFLQRSRQAGKRCVLVVHGRGLHSKDQVPILKEALKRWMATARFADHVLAFATARPHDGGLGAVYVLLRRL